MTMNPKDALQLLDRLVADIKLDRAMTFATVRALETLAAVVEKAEAQKPENKPEEAG